VRKEARKNSWTKLDQSCDGSMHHCGRISVYRELWRTEFFILPVCLRNSCATTVLWMQVGFFHKPGLAGQDPILYS